MEQTLAEFELDRRSFHVLGRLRSYGKPYQRSAGMLAKDMRLSSGAMTNRRSDGSGSSDDSGPERRRGTHRADRGGAYLGQERLDQARREAMISSVLSPAEREHCTACCGS